MTISKMLSRRQQIIVMTLLFVLFVMYIKPANAAMYVSPVNNTEHHGYYGWPGGTGIQVLRTYWAPTDRYVAKVEFRFGCQTASGLLYIDIWDGAKWVNVKEAWIRDGNSYFLEIVPSKAVRFRSDSYYCASMYEVLYTLWAVSPTMEDSNNVLNAANAAKTEAINAKNNTYDSGEGKSAATLAREARDKATASLTEVNNVKNIVSNIQASVGPQITKVSGLNVATCTSTDSFNVVVQVSNATDFRTKADSGAWDEWVPAGYPATVTGISGKGAHTIYVEARNTTGTIASGQIVIFRI